MRVGVGRVGRTERPLRVRPVFLMEPIAQVDVEADIVRLSSAAERAMHELAKRCRAHAEAEVAHKREWAKAFLAAEGTVRERECQADVATTDLFQARRMAEALERSAQEAGRTYRAQLDGLRSLNANHRALVVGS